MNKAIKEAALSHAICYLTEELWTNEQRLKSSFRDWNKDICSVKNIRELVAVENDLHQWLWQQHTPMVEEFYQAMLKVTPLRIARDKADEEYEDINHYHSNGTECRGWYRVWGGIRHNTGYFCRFDLGRDQYMANTFYEAGCITDKEWANYKTYITMEQYIYDRYNIDAVKAYWKPESLEKVLDMKLVRALETA